MKYLIIDAYNFVLIAAAVAVNINNGEYTIGETVTMILKGMLKKLYAMFPEVDKTYACWDSYGGTFFRKEIDPNYKSNRDHKLIDFQVVESCRSILSESVLNCVNITLPETEADDTIFCLCKALREKDSGAEITIVSRDKDLIQTVQAGYANYIFDYSKKKNMEIPWYNITEYKALVGDTSDNLKGVPGIGNKRAIKLISEKIVTGKYDLTPEQYEQYENCLKIVDAKLHPKFEENCTNIVKVLENGSISSKS